MEAKPIISAKDLSKHYLLWKNPLAQFTWTIAKKFPVLRRSKILEAFKNRHSKSTIANQRINLEVFKGEAIGIIGRNGSGKSTLLQVITGILEPTSGQIRTHGKVAALLELGTGFNPEFSGLENIKLGARLYGLSPNEIKEKTPNIIAYSELSNKIDQPVKTYSTGMRMRLAFSVAIHVDADTLIIDEALGVGDARFQLKCAKTIDQWIAEEKTLLFVSHDPNAIKRYCNSAALLESGELLFHGRPNEVINLYSKLLDTKTTIDSIKDEVKRYSKNGTESVSRKEYSEAAKIRRIDSNPLDRKLKEALETIPEINTSNEYSYGNDTGYIERIWSLNKFAESTLTFETGEISTFIFKATSKQNVLEPIFALTIKSKNGQEVYGTNTLFNNSHFPEIHSGEEFYVRFDQPLNLISGEYFLSFGFTHFVDGNLEIIHRRYDSIKILITQPDKSFGIANCYSQISFLKEL